MSDKIDEMQERLELEAAKERKRREVQEKELKVRDRRADLAIEKIDQGDKDTALSKTIDYNLLSDEEIVTLQKDNEEYMMAAKNKMHFVNETFDKAVPFFRKNLILVGAPTGSGKSTAVANIAYSLITKKKPDGTVPRILVLTNEEKSEDVYNRITCLLHGWSYTNHDEFTPEQIAIFTKNIGVLKNRITVIDDHYGGALGTTTSVEGICQVFDNLIAREEYYDAVLFDYYQNCTESRRNPYLGEYEVQALLCRRLDKYKNVYPAPIVVFAQIKDLDDDGTLFKWRIEGRKLIMNVCTCAIEITVNRPERLTVWTVWKSRFNKSVGSRILTGFDSGKYVKIDKEFEEKVKKWKDQDAQHDFDKAIGAMPTPKEEE